MLSFQQGEHHAIGGHDSGAVVVEGIWRRARLSVAAVAKLHTGGGLRVLVEARAHRPVSLLTEGVDGRVNDARVALTELLVTNAQTLGNAFPESLQEDVGGVGETVERFKAGVSGDIQADTALASSHIEPGGQAGNAVLGINLDDVGAVFGQRSAAGRSREDDAEVEDSYSFQGSGHGSTFLVRLNPRRAVREWEPRRV